MDAQLLANEREPPDHLTGGEGDHAGDGADDHGEEAHGGGDPSQRTAPTQEPHRRPKHALQHGGQNGGQKQRRPKRPDDVDGGAERKHQKREKGESRRARGRRRQLGIRHGRACNTRGRDKIDAGGSMITRAVVVACCLTFVGGAAAAQVCVALDAQRDTLAPEDRRAATISMMQALQKNGQQVVAQDCAGTFTFYNVKLGATISVYLYGPGGEYRESRATKLDELPMVYEQLVRALMTGQSMATGGTTVDRTNATVDQMAPRRVQADDLKYLRIGYGSVAGGDLVGGPAFGFGWRHELDRLAIDLSFLNLVVATDAAQ